MDPTSPKRSSFFSGGSNSKKFQICRIPKKLQQVLMFSTKFRRAENEPLKGWGSATYVIRNSNLSRRARADLPRAPPRSLRSPSSAPRPVPEIRNPVVIIVQRRAFRTNLGGLVLGCIEANWLQGNTYCGAFVEIRKAYALLHVWNPIWKPLKERLQSVIRSKLKSFPTFENLVDKLLAE